MAYSRVKSNSCADRIPSGLFTIFIRHDSHIHIHHFLRMQYPCQTFHRFCCHLKISGKIIAGTHRNISHRHLRQFGDSIQHFIYRTVTAKYHNGVFFPICGNLFRNPACMSLVFSKMYPILCLLLFQKLLEFFPDPAAKP